MHTCILLGGRNHVRDEKKQVEAALSCSTDPNCYWKWSLAPHHLKASTREARLVERKVCFISETSNRRRGRTHVQSDNQWARAFKGEFQGFIGRGRGYMQKQHSQLWPSSWNWSCSGLISVILIVLSTANLQFQDPFVPISLTPVFGIVAAYVMATVWSSCS